MATHTFLMMYMYTCIVSQVRSTKMGINIVHVFPLLHVNLP